MLPFCHPQIVDAMKDHMPLIIFCSDQLYLVIKQGPGNLKCKLGCRILAHPLPLFLYALTNVSGCRAASFSERELERLRSTKVVSKNFEPTLISG